MRQRLLDEGLRFLRYGAVGTISTAVLYVAFLVLVAINVNPVLAAGICYPVGVAFSYLGNRRFTFASDQTHRSDLPRFIAAYGVGFVSNLGVLVIALLWLPPSLAQLLNIAITPTVIFSTLRVVGFGSPKAACDASDSHLDC